MKGIAARSISFLGAAPAVLASLPAMLVGPIFTKELRVSSRRRRTFVLRTVYAATLTVFAALVWLATVRWGTSGSGAYRIYQMSAAGRTIICSVVWFQFVVTQLIAVVMLSNSISEEIYHRTLGVLMTTPIHSFQVIVGKLLSKMLQLLMLLAMSLPLLAIVRVFGGVPWGFVLAGVCLAVCVAVFVASVTMFYSILFRRAFVSILLALGTLFVLYALLPMIVRLAIALLSLPGRSPMSSIALLLVHLHPYYMLGALTASVFMPRAGMVFGTSVLWWVTCAVMLGMAAAVLTACVALVRRAALRQAAGATGAGPAPPKPTGATGVAAGPQAPPADPSPSPPAPPVIAPPAAAPHTGRVRTVHGSPVVWRELHAPWMRRKLLAGILVGIGGALLITLYALLAAVNGGGAFSEDDVHVTFVAIFTGLSVIASAILSATGITAEKEAGSWHILLGTPLRDGQILWGKLVGVLRKSLMAWVLPYAHVAVFVAIQVTWWLLGSPPLKLIHPALLVHLTLVAISVVGLLAGSGLYFGSRFKRTTTAVIMNLGLCIALWAALPGLLALAAEALPSGPSGWRSDLRELTEYSIDLNPVFQAGLVTERVSGYRARKGLRQISYNWGAVHASTFAETTAFLACSAAGYVAIGGLFAWRAKCHFRKKVF